MRAPAINSNARKTFPIITKINNENKILCFKIVGHISTIYFVIKQKETTYRSKYKQ